MTWKFTILRRAFRFASLPLCLLACAGFVEAGAAELGGRISAVAAQSEATLGLAPEQRLRDQLRLLLLDMIESGAFGQIPPEQISLAIDSPRERFSNLGVLVDSSDGKAASDGLHVLGTTPGSSAARMGLRAGDVLMSVNAVSLAGLGDGDGGVAKAAVVLREEVSRSQDGANLSFEVQREGKRSTISGMLAATWIPAMQLRVGDGVSLASASVDAPSAASAAAGCGRISIFDVAPRQRHLHAATLISIDGRRSPFDGQTAFRVSAGRHVLIVGERIDSRYLAFNDRLRNSGGDERYKTLTVEVAANTTYSLAAQINQDKRNEWRDGAFWDPVIWNESAETCR